MANVVFGIYLIWVSLQDFREMQVIRYSHMLGVGAILLEVLQIVFLENSIYSIREYSFAAGVLLAFQIIAHLFQLYGIADMYVFLLCGIFLLLRKGIDEYLISYFMVQAISGILLFIVQLTKRNVKGTSLRCPVPYIPYISVAFFLTNMVL